MNTHVFFIQAKTNLHVGNEGGDDFTIIDKPIQRDPLTGLPCINSSSLKGAINEYCTNAIDMDAKLRIKLFGSDKNDKNDNQKGRAIFFDAKLLFLPQQGDENLYHFVTSEEVINMMKERVKLFDKDFDYTPANKEFGKDVNYDEEDEKLSDLCDNDNLPIIARNKLENGESQNLWYEQVLPAETVLYTIIREEGEDLKNALDGKLVQIGANATIGYGYCKFILHKTIEEK